MPDRTTTYTPDRENLTDQASDTVQRTREAINDATEKAKDRAKEMARTAVDKIDEQRSTVGDALHSASETLHTNAERLPGERMTGMAHAAADKLDTAADYVQEHDMSEMANDVIGVVKRYPAQSLAIAVGLGFLIGRAFRSDND